MSITVYRNTDRVRLQIHDVIFTIKPFTYKEKADITSSIRVESGEQIDDGLSAIQKLLKYSVKDVTGINYPDGTTFKLKFDKDNVLEEESIDELLNLEINQDLTSALYVFVRSIPSKLTNTDGEDLPHTKILPFQSMPKKK